MTDLYDGDRDFKPTAHEFVADALTLIGCVGAALIVIWAMAAVFGR